MLQVRRNPTYQTNAAGHVRYRHGMVLMPDTRFPSTIKGRPRELGLG
jgi:hypothetical protein